MSKPGISVHFPHWNIALFLKVFLQSFGCIICFLNQNLKAQSILFKAMSTCVHVMKPNRTIPVMQMRFKNTGRSTNEMIPTIFGLSGCKLLWACLTEGGARARLQNIKRKHFTHSFIMGYSRPLFQNYHNQNALQFVGDCLAHFW